MISTTGHHRMISAFLFLGAIASIVGVLIPAQTWRQRMIHVVYGAAVITLAYFTFSYQNRIDRITSIERSASRMIHDRQMNYTNLGFIHATLAFLEKNSDLYPDTYARAVTMCEQYRCDSPEGDSLEAIGLASALSGVLKGIATIDSEE